MQQRTNFRTEGDYYKGGRLMCPLEYDDDCRGRDITEKYATCLSCEGKDEIECIDRVQRAFLCVYNRHEHLHKWIKSFEKKYLTYLLEMFRYYVRGDILKNVYNNITGPELQTLYDNCKKMIMQEMPILTENDLTRVFNDVKEEDAIKKINKALKNHNEIIVDMEKYCKNNNKSLWFIHPVYTEDINQFFEHKIQTLLNGKSILLQTLPMFNRYQKRSIRETENRLRNIDDFLVKMNQKYVFLKIDDVLKKLPPTFFSQQTKKCIETIVNINELVKDQYDYTYKRGEKFFVDKQYDLRDDFRSINGHIFPIKLAIQNCREGIKHLNAQTRINETDKNRLIFDCNNLFIFTNYMVIDSEEYKRINK